MTVYSVVQDKGLFVHVAGQPRPVENASPSIFHPVGETQMKQSDAFRRKALRWSGPTPIPVNGLFNHSS
jgi:hypothetical protein